MSAQQAREAARRADGTFGRQLHAEADVAAMNLVPRTDQASEDADLAYLREILNRANAPGPSSAVPALVPTLTGADMPPLTFSHPEPLDIAKVSPARTEGSFPKPLDGLWATVGDIADPEPTPWERFCQRHDFRGGAKSNVRSRVTLRPDARVVFIDSRSDYEALAAEFPNASPYDEDYFDAFGERRATPLDWGRVGEVYDAVWVTNRAIGDSQFHNGLASPLHTWDMESVVVLRPDALVDARPEAQG